MTTSVFDVFDKFLKSVYDNVKLESVSLCESPQKTSYHVSFSVIVTGVCPRPELAFFDDVYVYLYMHKIRDFQFTDLNISTLHTSSKLTPTYSWVACFVSS